MRFRLLMNGLNFTYLNFIIIIIIIIIIFCNGFEVCCVDVLTCSL